MRHGQRSINSMHPAEIASLIESLPPAKREIVWEFVDPDIEGDVLIELNEEVRAELIGGMDAEELIAATEGMEVDDLADLIGDLPETLNQRVLRSMDAQDRERLSAVAGVRGGQRRRSDEPRRGHRPPGRDAGSGAALPAHARRAARPHRPAVRRQSPRPVPRRAGHHPPAHRGPRKDRRRSDGRGGRGHPAGNAGPRSRQAVRGPRPGLGRGRQPATADCSAASRSTTWSTSSARKPITR